MTIVIAAILLNEKGEVLIAQRNRNKALGGFWELPGGKIEPNESDAQCLVREIREELNVDIEVMEHFCDSLYEYDFGTILLKAYLAKIVGGTMVLNDHEDSRWCSIEELGEVKDFTPAGVKIIEAIRIKCRKNLSNNETFFRTEKKV